MKLIFYSIREQKNAVSRYLLKLLSMFLTKIFLIFENNENDEFNQIMNNIFFNTFQIKISISSYEKSDNFEFSL